MSPMQKILDALAELVLRDAICTTQSAKIHEFIVDQIDFRHPSRTCGINECFHGAKWKGWCEMRFLFGGRTEFREKQVCDKHRPLLETAFGIRPH